MFHTTAAPAAAAVDTLSHFSIDYVASAHT